MAQRKPTKKKEPAVASKTYPFIGTVLRTSKDRAVELREEDVLNELLRMYCRDKTGRADQEEEWKKNIDAYMMRPIVPDPELSWQSTVNLADIHRYVEMGAAKFRKAVMQAGNFFQFDPLIPELADVGPILQKLCMHYIRTSTFAAAFEKSLKFGFLTGFIGLLPRWERKFMDIGTKTVSSGTITYDSADTLELVVDQDNRYFFHREWIPNERISALMKLGHYWQAPLQDYPPMEDIDKDLRESLYYDYTAKENMGEIIRFEGTFYSGQMYFPGYEITILNRQHIIQARPIKNWLNSPLVAHTQFYEVLKGEYGLSLVDIIMPTFIELTLLYRMFMDQGLLSMGGMIEVIEDAFDEGDVDKLRKDGIKPFHLLFKKIAVEGKAIQKTDYAQFNNSIFPMIQQLRNDMDRATPALNEVTMGLPTSKGRPTAKEIMAKMGAGGEVLSSIAERIESNILAKVAIQTIVLIFQNETDEKIANIIGKDKLQLIMQIGKERIVELLLTDCGIKVDTITVYLQRQEQIQKMLSFLETIQGLPNKTKVNFDYFIRQLAILFGLSPSDTFVKEDEQQKKAEQATIELLSKYVLDAFVNNEEANKEFTRKVADNMAERVAAMVDLKQFLSVKGKVKNEGSDGRTEESDSD